MRIALLSHTGLYWTEIYARFLTSVGHDVRVLSFSREPIAGVDVRFIGKGTPDRMRGLAYLLRVPRTRKELRRFAPDVVVATYISSNGLIAALCGAKPLLLSAHGSDVLTAPGGKWLSARMLRFTCRRAEIIHVVSPTIGARLAERGADADKIRCFAIGIDTDWFRPRTEPLPAEQRTTIVCTRKHEPIYRNDTIVLALKALRDEGLAVHATFVGGGMLLDERRDQVKQLGLDDLVRLPGPMARDEVRSELQDAAIYVSASESDGASSSLLEAMACGVFPVVSDIQGNRDWIEDGVTGLTFKPGDYEGLAKAIRRAVDDDELRNRARERNRARVIEDGNLERNLAKMAELIDGLGAQQDSSA